MSDDIFTFEKPERRKKVDSFSDDDNFGRGLSLNGLERNDGRHKPPTTTAVTITTATTTTKRPFRAYKSDALPCDRVH